MRRPRADRRANRRRALRWAAAVLPLPALLAPAPAQAGAPLTVALCGAGGERTIVLPARRELPHPDDQPGCAHFVCPRERNHGTKQDGHEA